MKILVFDTETTGLLPKGFNANKSNLINLPYIVQLSFIVYDEESNKVIVTYDSVIKVPETVTISEESSNIHGITNAISRNNGINIIDALEILKIVINNVNCIVAHNFDFDINMLCIECMRNNMEIELLKNNPLIVCTMKQSKELCNIVVKGRNGDNYIKYPRLEELHDKLFGNKPNNLHNSFNDVIVCLRCYFKLRFNKDICKINRNINALYNKNCK
tara:strand:- start:5338 stop:5988 length:651 start_codon:yes stop_codon:yes gene_type:complete